MRDKEKHGRSYAVNSASDADPATATAGRLINDQNGATGKTFRLGRYPASYNACEGIAVHNALTLLGLPSRLSEVLDVIERKRYFWFINNGVFGTNPRRIPRIAARFGAKCERVKPPKGYEAPGVYIISYFNGGKIRRGVHTVCFERTEEGFRVYNYATGRVSTADPAVFAARPVRCYRVEADS